MVFFSYKIPAFSGEMQDSLQDAAPYSQGFIGDEAAVLRLAARVHVAALHAGSHRDAVCQQSPQRAANRAAHGYAVDSAGDLSGGRLAADFQRAMEEAVRRGAQYPFPGKAADQAGDGGVGEGGAAVDNAPAWFRPPRGSRHWQ